jgi:hypothetical protein
MVSVLASSLSGHVLEPRSDQTKDYEIGMCCFAAVLWGSHPELHIHTKKDHEHDQVKIQKQFGFNKVGSFWESTLSWKRSVELLTDFWMIQKFSDPII